ncbi:MAG: hypothetical protein U0360_07950 [Dehalococcoidia bacterium]
MTATTQAHPKSNPVRIATIGAGIGLAMTGIAYGTALRQVSIPRYEPSTRFVAQADASADAAPRGMDLSFTPRAAFPVTSDAEGLSAPRGIDLGIPFIAGVADGVETEEAKAEMLRAASVTRDLAAPAPTVHVVWPDEAFDTPRGPAE